MRSRYPEESRRHAAIVGRLAIQTIRAIVACVHATVSQTQPLEAQELAKDLGALVRHLLAVDGRNFLELVEELDLSLSQLKSLQVLYDAPEPLSVKALSDRLGLSLPAVSRAVDALVRRGEVTRDEDPSDRRCKRVTLSAGGRRTFERLIALRAAGIRRFVDQLDPEDRTRLAAAMHPVARKVSR